VTRKKEKERQEFYQTCTFKPKINVDKNPNIQYHQRERNGSHTTLYRQGMENQKKKNEWRSRINQRRSEIDNVNSNMRYMSTMSKKILEKKAMSDYTGSNVDPNDDRERCASPISVGSVNSKSSTTSKRVVNDFINRNFYSAT
jgi:hypothetical protein